ncbi:hypothetical protein BC832DRAFT_487611 [Gaertneriomyces semiglobifer]|nr:hypothetical protein BC832DRAFT_487611 [Gaertneriomyces semiglobifer]
MIISLPLNQVLNDALTSSLIYNFFRIYSIRFRVLIVVFRILITGSATIFRIVFILDTCFTLNRRRNASSRAQP